jgi:hypothetical protein
MSGAIHFAEGRYVCRIKSQEMSTSGNGNLQLMLSFAVLGTPDPQNPENYLRDPNERHELTRRLWLVFTDKTMDFALGHLATLGWHGESLKELDSRSPGFHSFRDQVVDLWCKHEGDRERWQVSTKAPAVAREEKLKELDRLLMQHRKGVKGTAA